MGIVSNYPIALAAGLGINGAVAFGLVLSQGLSPAGAMGVIVLEGLVVLLLVLVGLREAVMNAVPLGLKRAIGVGIGLFILFIGFVDAGLIINNPDANGPVPVFIRLPRDGRRSASSCSGSSSRSSSSSARCPAAFVISIIVDGDHRATCSA